MSDWKRREAQRLHADASKQWIEQAEAIVLREADANEENPRMVEFAPSGNVLGIRVYRKDDPPKSEDEGMAFISIHAFTAMLGSLGLVLVPGSAIVAASPAAYRADVSRLTEAFRQLRTDEP